MSNYIEIYHNYKDSNSLRGKLKPVSCPACADNGCSYQGECETCLKNQAFNKEYLETHSFIMDDEFRGYHYDGHNQFKTLPLRLPHEHPYLYYGIEIEIGFSRDSVTVYGRDDDYYDDDYDDGDDNWEINDILAEFSKITEGMFIYEYDGSLDNGVECISRPTSYAYWTHKDTVEKLRKGLKFLREKGAYIDQPNGNGLHIHISRKFFDNGQTKLSDRSIAYQNFDWLFQKFQPQIEKLGGREYTHYCESKASKLRKSLVEENWNMRAYNVEAEIKCKLKKGGQLPEGDHYSAVNTTRKTIEARVFKSSTDYKQILADIEMVRNFAHAVREEDIKRSFNDILHTKENLYLDELVRKTKMNCRRDKQDIDLDEVNNDEIEITVTKKAD